MTRSSALVRLLSDPETPAPVQMRTGIVRTVNTATTPHTVSVDVGGITVTGLTYPHCWDAEVGAVVSLLQQGPKLDIYKVAAPARVKVGEHNHTTPPTNPPAPPAPPAAPVAPTGIRTVSVLAASSASWVPAFSNWRVDGVYQGGTGQRGFWFYGTGIASAKGAGTILSATVFVKRSSSGGINGGANVRLGTHGNGTQPANGGTAHANVEVVGTLPRDAGATFALTAAQVAALNAGAAGVGLEPGASGFVTADYLIAVPRSAGDFSGALQLTIQG